MKPNEEECKKKWPALLIACREGHIPIVQYLIEKGAKIEALDIKQKTPLHWACEKGYLPIVQSLIEKGANIEANSEDQSLLFIGLQWMVKLMLLSY